MSIFKEESGKWSSKRIAGLSSFAVCLIAFIWDFVTAGTVNFTMWASLLGVGTTVLGITGLKPSAKVITPPPGTPLGNEPDDDKN